MDIVGELRGQAEPAAGPAPAKAWSPWIDFAKATAIMLVVVYHVGGAGMGYLFPDQDGVASTFWGWFNKAMLPMRMPLFFVTAGVLAYGAVNRPWKSVWRNRVGTQLWTYLLWSMLFAAVAGFAYQPEDPVAYAASRLYAIPFAGTGYWFLAVLVVFFIAAKLLRRVASVVLAIALILAAIGPDIEQMLPESWPTPFVYAVVKVTRYAFWFFLGCYAREKVLRLSEIRPVFLIAIGGASFVALTLAGVRWDLLDEFSFALSVAGLVGAVGVSVFAVRSPRVAKWSEFFAKRTLPIYLVHPLLINLLVLTAVIFGLDLHANEPLTTILTLPISAACIFIAVRAYDRVIRTRYAWVFRFPSRI